MASAQWYRLSVVKDGIAYFSKWFQGTSWVPDWHLVSGSYAWSVQTWNRYGFGAWSGYATFDILYKVPGVCAPYDPNGTVTTSRPVFTWEDNGDAVGFRLIVQRAGRKVIRRWIEGEAAYTPTAAEALRYGRYRWWVRGWSPDGFGPWSDAREFVYGQVEAWAPLGRIQGTARPAFSWTPVADAQRYQCWIQRNGAFYIKQWHLTPDWTPPVDLPIGRYTWYVRAWNVEGAGPWSMAATFTLGEAVPERPAGVVSGPPGWALSQVRWDNSGCEQADWYEVWIGEEDTALAQFWVDAGSISRMGGSRLANIPAEHRPIPPGSYTWHIRTWQQGDFGSWSKGLDFTVP